VGRSNHREAVWVVAACSSRGTTPEGKPAAKAEPAAESGAGSFALYTSVPQNSVNRMQETLKRAQPGRQM